jgi:CelD/BcsL family acetyltransferase involved in cellulose biosynthesis
MHYYLGGFDPAWDRFSPGSLLIQYALEFAREAGDSCFDFLRGAEPYKYRWGAVDRPQYRICT